MTEQSTPSDLAAWVLDHGVGLPPARQKQLAKGYRRLEAQTDIRGRAVAIYQARAREAEERLDAADRQIAARTGETAAERLLKERAMQAEARVKAVLSVVQEWESAEVRYEVAPIMRAASTRIRRSLEDEHVRDGSPATPCGRGPCCLGDGHAGKCRM